MSNQTNAQTVVAIEKGELNMFRGTSQYFRAHSVTTFNHLPSKADEELYLYVQQSETPQNYFKRKHADCQRQRRIRSA
jgi:hypothetical protein